MGDCENGHMTVRAGTNTKSYRGVLAWQKIEPHPPTDQNTKYICGLFWQLVAGNKEEQKFGQTKAVKLQERMHPKCQNLQYANDTHVCISICKCI